QDEDLPVADLPGMRRILDGLGDDLRPIVVDQDLELHLGEELHYVLGASIQLRVTLLPPEPFHLRDRHALDTVPRQSFLHLVELEGFDDRFDLLHRLTPSGTPRAPRHRAQALDWEARDVPGPRREGSRLRGASSGSLLPIRGA